MRFHYTTKELLDLLYASGLTCTENSPVRTLMTLPFSPSPQTLSDREEFLCRMMATPEKVFAVGRHSAADGWYTILNIGAIYVLYTYFEGKDKHIFLAYYDRPGLIKNLPRLLYAFYRPNFGAFTQFDCLLEEDEYVAWQLIRALFAERARAATVTNAPFLADDLKEADVALYLRNALDELGFSALSDTIDLLVDEAHHTRLDNALEALREKGLLQPDYIGDGTDPAYCLSRTTVERLDDGMLLDTVWVCDQTDPQNPREVLFSLRRDGILSVFPTRRGIHLRTQTEIPWEELL